MSLIDFAIKAVGILLTAVGFTYLLSMLFTELERWFVARYLHRQQLAHLQKIEESIKACRDALNSSHDPKTNRENSGPPPLVAKDP